MSNSEAGEAALALHRLLGELHPYPLPSNVFAYRQQPYTAPVVQLVAHFRRINHRGRDDVLVGINEFNIALCYCSWQQFDRAQRHLSKAELRWKMAGRPAYYALAQYATGRVLQLAMTYEPAARVLYRAEGTIDELLNQTPTNRPRETHPPLPLLKKLKRHIVDAQEELFKEVVALLLPRVTRPSVGSDQPTQPDTRGAPLRYPFIVPAPRIQIASDEPEDAGTGAVTQRRDPADSPDRRADNWYEITRRTGSFLPQLHLGDQLRVVPLLAGAAPLRRNQLLVIDRQRLDGQVQVVSVGDRGESVPANSNERLVVQLVRETTDGRLAIIAHDQRRPLTCRRSDVVGVVDGLWRVMQGIG